jgi:ketosteroid isomerase-like protein
MTDRAEIAKLVSDLHSARMSGDLAGMCRTFANDASFQIAGASDGKPIAITASGLSEFRPWLSMMVKAFRLSDYALLSLLVDGHQASAHWRVRIFSKITGVEVPTELVDLVEVRSGHIASYKEFFVPR